MDKSVATSLCLLLLYRAVASLSTIDTFKPIVRFSPVRGVETDEFGYSVAAHRMDSNASGFTDTLASTFIIVGAPLGKYPGGLDLPLDASVCELYDELRMVTRDRSALTDEEIRECYLRTGLVYSCPLIGNTGCGPVLGNMNASGPDGALFDRVGNLRQLNNFKTSLIIQQNKDRQRMGSIVYSSGEFFTACAPFWHDLGDRQMFEAPAGMCVFSGRDLQNFQYTRPCAPGNSNNNGQDEFCLSGHSAAIRKGEQLGDSILGVTTPGRFDYSGGVYYYSDLTSTEPAGVARQLELGETRGPTVNAHVDINVDLTAGPLTVPNAKNSLYGFATAVGKFNGNESSEYFFVSSPRFSNASGSNSVGRVYVVTDIDAVANTTADGDEFGEYFGYSIATADLNGDGYDDVVVGAPMYSKTNLPELGRVVIIYNDRGRSLVKNVTVEGTESLGRFGHSVTNLGDLNGDECDDIAVSAPFDKNGKVFIYYGSKGSGLINTTAQQTITAEQMINQVTNLSAINVFGFSLDGKVDVDGNQYRDLVVSAIGTSNNTGQAVFVLRSFPVAEVSLNITDFPDEINRDTKNCTVNNNATICFNISLCGTFTGRGLTNINPRYQLEEIIVSRQRVFFDPADVSKNKVEGFLNLSSAGQQLCQPITVYIVNDLTPDEALTPVNLTFSLLPFNRSQTAVDTNFQPDDLVSFPIIQSAPFETSIRFALNCGPDDICISDLELNLLDVTYFDTNNRVLSGTSVLTAGEVSRMAVNLRFRNNEEDGFRPVLALSLPSVFSGVLVSNMHNLIIVCNPSTVRDNGMVNYTCDGFPNPLEKSDMFTDIQLTWQVSQTGIQGNEGSFDVPIVFRIGEGSDRNIEKEAGNNMVMVNVPVNARSRVNVEINGQRQTTLAYFGNQSISSISLSSVPNHIIQYLFRNMGPTMVSNATLTMLLPFRVPNQQNRFYIYPYNISVSGSVVCDTEGVINPENVVARRRSIGMMRPVRQASTENPMINCLENPASCDELTCQIFNVSSTGSASVTLNVVLDERFYYNMERSFTLTVSASAVINDLFINTTNSRLNVSNTINIIRAPQQGQIPIYAFIIPALVAPLVIAGLAVLLYFCGCFRRKKPVEKVDGEGNNEDFEAFDKDPFNQPKLTAMKQIDEKA